MARASIDSLSPESSPFGLSSISLDSRRLHSRRERWRPKMKLAHNLIARTVEVQETKQGGRCSWSDCAWPNHSLEHRPGTSELVRRFAEAPVYLPRLFPLRKSSTLIDRPFSRTVNHRQRMETPSEIRLAGPRPIPQLKPEPRSTPRKEPTIFGGIRMCIMKCAYDPTIFLIG